MACWTPGLAGGELRYSWVQTLSSPLSVQGVYDAGLLSEQKRVLRFSWNCEENEMTKC